MSKISDEINKNNVWYQLGKEYAKVCGNSELDDFLKSNGLYTTINPSSTSSFKKDTFEKFILVLDKNNIDTSRLKEMYLEWSNIQESKTNGFDRYSFYWGYDVEKMEQREFMTFAEATEKWDLGESTLRSTVRTNRLTESIDYKKSGKVWLITVDAMTRLYGEPKTVLDKAKEIDEFNNSLPEIEIGEETTLGCVWDGEGETPEGAYSYKLTDADYINYEFDIVEENEEDPLETTIKVTNIEIV